MAALALQRIRVEDTIAGGDMWATADATARARAAWPGIDVSDDRFGAWLTARVDRALPPADALAALQVSDLYLACACAAGDATALARFDAELLTQVPRFVARLGRAVDVAEVQQQLRERLFCGATPRIVEYTGRGPLVAWLRVAAVRTALNEQRRQSPGDGEDGASLPAALDDPELTLLGARYRDAFTDAVREALDALDERPRVLLKLHLVDGVTLPRLAGMYAVDRATVVRWLAQAREAVRTAAFAALRARVGGSEAELHSVLTVLRSRLDVSLGGLLRQR